MRCPAMQPRSSGRTRTGARSPRRDHEMQTQEKAMINQSVKEFDRAGSRIAADFRAMIADSEDLLKAAATVSGDGLAAARAKFEEKVSRAKIALADASQPILEKTRETAAAANSYVHD